MRDVGAFSSKRQVFITIFSEGSEIYKEKEAEGFYELLVVEDSKETSIFQIQQG